MNVQRFSKTQLERSRHMAPMEILRFVEGYRAIHLPRRRQASKLISLKLSQALLNAFKDKSQIAGVPYQTQIKVLMRQWLGQV